MIYRDAELTVYALEGKVEIVCLPGANAGTMVQRCDKASKIILNKKETQGLIATLRDAIRILREEGY